MYHDIGNKSLLFHFACSLTTGIGPLKFRKIINHFDSCESAWNSDINTLSRIVGKKEAFLLKQLCSEDRLSTLLHSFSKKNIFVIHLESELYPLGLKPINDSPICLFVKTLDNPAVYFKKLNDTILLAVIGSRRHTTYGRVATQNIVSGLTSSNILIVSGMALGIDSVAHITALKNNGKTMAVLGCGVDVIYPPENSQLYESILESSNCIISEFAPGTRPSKGSFIARNRIISGISSGTLIIEGDEKSGSLTTAGFAAEQGKDVFALPGPVTSPLSQAPLRLLKNGAHLVTQPEDILDFYNLNSKSRNFHSSIELAPNEERLRDLLAKESLFIDDIMMMLSMPIQDVTNVLTKLEIAHVIERDELGKYHLSSV